MVAYMTLRGLLAPARVQLENVANIDLTTHGLKNQNIGTMLGALVGLKGGSARAIAAAIAVALLLWFCFKDAAFRRSARDIVAGLVIGLATVAGWWVTGVLAVDDFNPSAPLASVTLVAPVGDGLQYLMTFTGATINFGIAVAGGIIAGSFLTALACGTFRIESFSDRDDLIRHLSGAALMGLGGVLALGCTIGQGVTGMSTLALGSVIAWLSILGGGYFGIKYLEEGSLSGALRALLARG
jgi:hypothetical protein